MYQISVAGLERAILFALREFTTDASIQKNNVYNMKQKKQSYYMNLVIGFTGSSLKRKRKNPTSFNKDKMWKHVWKRDLTIS